MTKTAPKYVRGWWWRGIGTAALLVVPVALAWGAGWVLAHISDLITKLT